MHVGANCCLYWFPCDVDLQVVQHSQAAAASVANEIDLMMNFHHQNVSVRVGRWHFVRST
jgi:hypothetical protein